MSEKTQVTIKGLEKTYTVSPKCKKFTLRDNGFEETKSGNFQLVRSLDAIGSNLKNYRVKITVSKDLSELKVSTTSGNGLNAVDLYKLKNNQLTIEKFEFILEGLVDRDVLIEVTEN